MINHQGTKDTKTHQGKESQISWGVSTIAKIISLLSSLHFFVLS